MMIPPIVGVPALAWCSCGPSSRICWPNSRSRRNSMNFGDRKTQISSDAVPAIRTSPMRRSLQRLGDDLEPDPAGPLHEHHVSALQQLTHQRGSLAGIRDGVALAVERVEHDGRPWPDGDEDVDARGGRLRADLAVQLGLA